MATYFLCHRFREIPFHLKDHLIVVFPGYV